MKDEKSESSSRLAQVAKELHRLADGIGAGNVQISGVDLSLSDFVTLKVKQKMTGSKVVFDLKIQAQLVAGDKPPGKNMAGKKKSRKGRSRPYEIKALKKKYIGLWRVVAAAIKKDERPGEAAILDLQTVSKKYGEEASPEWTILWQAHEELVCQCVSAAQVGDFVKANEVLREIARGKKNCHKNHK